VLSEVLSEVLRDASCVVESRSERRARTGDAESEDMRRASPLLDDGCLLNVYSLATLAAIELPLALRTGIGCSRGLVESGLMLPGRE
jgi:hypothetical protein